MPDFWQDKPEIQDARLSLWLETKQSSSLRRQSEVMMAMIPSGENSFKLAAAAKEAGAQMRPANLKAARINGRDSVIVA